MSRPARFGCSGCDSSYELGAETRVFLFTKQPWLNYLITRCPSCRLQSTVWQLTEALVLQLQHNNMVEGDEVAWTINEFAGDHVVREFAAAHDLPYVPLMAPEDPWRSDRHQNSIDNRVAFLAYLLDQGEMPC